MKILIIHPPCRESVTPTLPLGLLYVAQPLIEDGHSVKFYDIALEKPNREEVISKIKSDEFDLIVIGGIVTTYGYIKWLTNEIKKIYPSAPILGGGFVATPIPHVIFENTSIDVICNGEGDITVKEYVKAVEAGTDPSDIEGLFIKSGASFIKTPDRPLIKNLDEISAPLDAHKLLNIERYITENGKSRQQTFESYGMWDSYLGDCRCFDILSGKGCIGQCTFCYRMLKGIRRHSVSYLIKHMEYLVENYNINFFEFHDELFLGNKKWTEEFCDAMEESSMDVRFRIGSRANMITDELLKKLKSIGCIDFTVGFESGSQKILDSMKKRIDVKDNYSAYNLLKKHNMITGVPTVQGMPDETRETMMETLKFIEDCKIEDAAVYYATPYPNSPIYQYALKENLIVDEDKYLELISDSDASEFKINLTKLSDTDMKYYHWLLAEACLKNKLSNQYMDRIGYQIHFCRFSMKHYFIKILYHVGLFNFAWKLKNQIESNQTKKVKI